MTNETHTGERTSAESPRAEGDQSGGRALLTGWLPSTYVIAFAFLYLGGTALSMVVATSVTANRLAEIGVSLLAVGLLLRVVRRVAGRRAITRIRPWLRRHIPVAGVRAKLSAYGDCYETGRGPAVTSAVLTRVTLPDRRWGAEIRHLVGSVVVYTFIGGLVVVLWRWSDTTLFVSASFLAGWLFALGALLSTYVALGSRVG